jgi:hypothetical protein
VDVDRNAATVVAHGYRTIGIEYDFDGAGMTGKRFVDGVIDDFVDHVMQARSVIGITDIHARSLADSIESLEDPDRFRAVFGGNGMLSIGDGLPGWFSHVGAFEGVPNQRGKRRLNRSICAMKDGLRLAQSHAQQAIE